MAVFDFVIQLQDKASGPAKAVSKELSATAQQMKTLQSAAKSTQNALTKADALGDIKKHQALTQQLASFKAALSALPQEAESASSGMGGLQAELAELTGGLSLVIEVAAGVAVAFGAVVVAGAAFAIQANEAKQAMLGLFDAMGEGKVSGAQTEEMIDGLKAKLGISKDAMVDWTKKLMAMGMTDLGQLEKSLTATASAAALVKGGDEAFEKLTKKIQTAVQAGTGLKIVEKGLAGLAGVGLTVDDVAKKMNVSAKDLAAQLKAGTVNAAKFGDAMQDALIEKGKGPLERLAASSANIKKLFMENIGDLFEDIDVGPFMQQVKELFDIFSQGKPSGQALKAGIGGFFKEVFALATKAVPYIKHFLLDLVIYGLKAYIGLKPIIKTIKEWINSASGMKTISMIFDAIVTTFKVVGVAVAVVIGLFVGLWAAMTAIAVVGYTLIGAVLDLTTKCLGALGEWASGAAEAAFNFVKGLVNGISSGAGMVVDAVKGLADGAKNAFKSALGIASPSKEMAKLGAFAGAGVSQGLDDSASDVHASAGGVGDAALAGVASAKGGGGAGGKGGGSNVTFEAGSILINGAGMGAMEITEEMISLVWERMALGAGVR